MGITQVLILLLHPIAALLVIREFARQRNWRKLSISLKGSERAAELENHEVQGERLFRLVLIVITIAFAAKVVHALILGEEFELSLLMPGHFHGWVGLLGLVLMTYLWSLGRKTSANKRAGESFAKVKQLHGRLSDVMMGLIVIHAFLGFLYLIQLIG
ncbi:MAG: hypothetical protein NZ780_03300 [Candidatus Poseidoniales archaeon]|nr:hypothetical protein [Candidatus Poseidoniales archaeon]MEC8954682.1 hypothetical protein [Candidatus Thermoplasmatota archaeon]MEE3201386.1 hypothetical protein [Candidatus Thermoplasmatota archaeon]MEE3303322.1 hypothetical protein [Candidatus Thermoplasmatota archaeon]